MKGKRELKRQMKRGLARKLLSGYQLGISACKDFIVGPVIIRVYDPIYADHYEIIVKGSNGRMMQFNAAIEYLIKNVTIGDLCAAIALERMGNDKQA